MGKGGRNSCSRSQVGMDAGSAAGAATRLADPRAVSSSQLVSLSATEQAQLGSLRLRANGQPSTHPWPSPEQWPAIRQHLLARSLASNPKLDPSLTAYTPGETEDLLEHPVIRAWHESAVAPVGEQYDTIVFVPCAKTKPWVGPAVRKSKLYSAYNQLREQMPNACFVTISEPLGVVPAPDWGDFPQYDNPGLFRDDSQRSGMTTKQWHDSPIGHCYGVPFDAEAQKRCLAKLGGVVGQFMANNADKRFVSFVDSAEGPASTHGHMLDEAMARTQLKVERHAKRGQARVSPLSYLQERLGLDG